MCVKQVIPYINASYRFSYLILVRKSLFQKEKRGLCDQTVLAMYKTTVSDKKFRTCRRKTSNIIIITDIVVLQR